MNIERATCTGRGALFAYSNHTCRCDECKERMSAERRRQYSENPEKFLANHKIYYQKNRRGMLSAKLKKAYGITIDERDNLFASQLFVCAVCGRKEDNGKNSFSVDHNHKTGKIRGILCSNCNTALGLLKEDKQIILSLINYLGKESHLES